MKGTKWTVGIVCGTALFAGAAFAGPPINGTGTVGLCTIAGSIKIKPALVNGGTLPIATKAKAKTTAACTGGTLDGATVTAFKAKGTGTGTSNDCLTLVGMTPSNLTLTVKWKVAPGNPKLNPSTIAFTTQNGGVGTTGGTFDLTGSVTAGSFNGNPVSVHVESDETLASLGTLCAGKGIKKITFGLTAGTATI